MSDINIWSTTDSGGAGITLPVAISQGGTGAIDAATALTNLGAYSKVEIAAIMALVATITASTGALVLPKGTTAERPATPLFGYIRGNTTLARVEWYNGLNWLAVGSGGGGGSSGCFIENAITQTSDYTITVGNNAVSAGPVTIADGVTVVIPTGSTWTIV